MGKSPPATDVVNDLKTVRDWLRFAVTTMNEGGVVFGHGTSTAVDEAAFLILETLKLPIDDINPWLDCRLTHSERAAIAAIVERRVATRRPASYLTNSAYIQGRKFYVDERVIVPRSFIGELLASDALAAVVADPYAITSVLDLCTGSGCLAILGAEAFPNARVTASDISEDALAVAVQNIAAYGLGERIETVKSDLFGGLGERRYDLIISNPPYVKGADVAAFPPEFAAEPALAHLGGADGLDLVNNILGTAGNLLSDKGHLVVEIGRGRDALEEAHPSLPFLWLDTETSSGEVFALSASELKA